MVIGTQSKHGQMTDSQRAWADDVSILTLLLIIMSIAWTKLMGGHGIAG